MSVANGVNCTTTTAELVKRVVGYFV